MSIFKSGISALGKLLIVASLATAFLFGLVGVVYMSLQGRVVQVPEITGKSYEESEKELSLLGLKIARRADRVTADAPNTILEQLPRSGETVKTGQIIRVVTSKQGPPGEETPTALKKTGDEDDTEKIEEMITDKPKKPKANSNTNKKKADTTRDVLGNISDSNSNSATGEPGSNKKEPGTNNSSGEKENKNTSAPQNGKSDKPPANKTIVIRPTSGETRPRATGKPQ
ncbi:MAG: PASTA domain-containing protein [Pyrinomonadaceae bacterium]